MKVEQIIEIKNQGYAAILSYLYNLKLKETKNRWCKLVLLILTKMMKEE